MYNINVILIPSSNLKTSISVLDCGSNRETLMKDIERDILRKNHS